MPETTQARSMVEQEDTLQSWHGVNIVARKLPPIGSEECWILVCHRLALSSRRGIMTSRLRIAP